MKKNIETLTGKWIYEEDYGYGKAKGELLLTQEGGSLSGKIIFSENVNGENSFMIQEIIEGEVRENRVYLKAVEYDIIHSESEIEYELDTWQGTLVDEDLIEGESLDGQGIVGNFSFRKLKVKV
ncbi:MAG: hypothetical protein ACEPOZ_06530 [Marinifilaceae bacterium]